MEHTAKGKIIKGVGGLYTVKLTEKSPLLPPELNQVECRAKGAFRHSRITPLVGDTVELLFEDTDSSPTRKEGGILIREIGERSNALIRPPIANVNYLFVTMAAASPAPILFTVDKLIAIAEFNHIEPIVVIGKCDLDPVKARELADLYRLSGFTVFPLSAKTGEGVDDIATFIKSNLPAKTAAFAGASGVGKSTLMNALFPDLALQTSEISRKIERGRHTTRHVELYELPNVADGYIADTPGFSMLDFERFDFFGKEDLPHTMREFAPHMGECRYKKCTHTKEEGCAIVEAVKTGEIAPSRHESYVALFQILKNKNAWDK